jgi:hypothetical protein
MSCFYANGISPGYYQVPGGNRTTRSLETDGVSKIVRIPGTSSIHNLTTAMSAFVWFKTTSTVNNTGLLAKNDYNGHRCWGIETLTSGTKAIGMVSADGSVASKTYATRAIINDGIWHHFGWTYTSGTLKIYLDGVEDTSPVKVTDTAITTINIDATTNVTIGGLLFGGTPSLLNAGRTNQPRIFNRVLTGAEVTELYNGGLNCELSALSFSSACVASYRFDGNDTLTSVKDESGHGNDGAYSGTLADYKLDVPDIYYGLSLATNKRIVRNHTASLNMSSQITVFTAFNFTTTGTEQALIGKTDYSAGKRSWWIEKDFRGGGQLLVWLSDNGGTAKKTYGTSLVQNTGSWRTFAFTFNAGTLKLYVNGVEDTSPEKITDTAMSSIFQNTDVPLSIGCIYSNTTPSLFYNGLLDEPRVFNTALSGSQILALHNAVFNYENTLLLDSGPSCVLGYNFNPEIDTTTTFVDITSNANNGTGTNFVAGDFVRGVA